MTSSTETHTYRPLGASRLLLIKDTGREGKGESQADRQAMLGIESTQYDGMAAIV